MEGASGGAAERPSFAEPAPALLGFDSSIWSFCSRALGRDTSGFSQSGLAERCVRSNNNILRLLSGGWAWNMCKLLQQMLDRAAPEAWRR